MASTRGAISSGGSSPEIPIQDTDDNGTDDYTLSYDEVGNLIDDDENYPYEYDPFGRLRKVMVHRPDLSLRRLTPSNCSRLLFDDVVWVRRARFWPP